MEAGGESLRGDNRAACLEAFQEFPRAFAVVVNRAIDQYDRGANGNVLGLLVWKVRHGEVEKTDRALKRAAEVEDIPL